jgi:recombination protein U
MKIIARGEKGRFTACFEKKAQPDYKGSVHDGKAIVFEAKATEKDRIKFDAITLAQFGSLESHWKIKAFVFVLVSFQLERYYRVPWGIWREMETFFGRKYLLETDIKNCRVEFKNGYLNFLNNIKEL